MYKRLIERGAGAHAHRHLQSRQECMLGNFKLPCKIKCIRRFPSSICLPMPLISSKCASDPKAISRVGGLLSLLTRCTDPTVRVRGHHFPFNSVHPVQQADSHRKCCSGDETMISSSMLLTPSCCLERFSFVGKAWMHPPEGASFCDISDAF